MGRSDAEGAAQGAVEGRLVSEAGGEKQVTVRVCPGGPLLVRGADSIVAADGTSHPVSRPVVAVCACGMSGRAPWCDGTHKVARRG